MPFPARTPKVLYFRDNIHRPGYGATESWVLPEGSEVIPELGVLVPCDNGEVTFIPWSNIKNVLWSAVPADKIVPLKRNAAKPSKTEKA